MKKNKDIFDLILTEDEKEISDAIDTLIHHGQFERTRHIEEKISTL